MFAALAVSFAAFTSPQQPPERSPTAALVVRGAVVHTGTDAPWSGDLRVLRGTFAPSGSAIPEQDKAPVLTLANAFVVPGLQDAHGHLLGLGDALAEVDLVGTASFAEVVDRARAAAAKLP